MWEGLLQVSQEECELYLAIQRREMEKMLAPFLAETADKLQSIHDEQRSASS